MKFHLLLTDMLTDFFVQMAERVAKLAGKTHKDRVNEFNTKLEALSEHHDIPKVSVNSHDLQCTFSSVCTGWTRLRICQ
jgi:hypothetical protein